MTDLMAAICVVLLHLAVVVVPGLTWFTIMSRPWTETISAAAGAMTGIGTVPRL
jgi:hypothetical protein